MSQIELNRVLMQNWIALNWSVLASKLCNNAKLNCLKRNCFLTLKLFLRNTELFEIEQFWTLIEYEQKKKTILLLNRIV